MSTPTSRATVDKYSESAAIYRAHSEVFSDDLDYYLRFCRGFCTLDMFAGYGRVTNHLARHGVDVEAVELNADLARQIALDASRVHVADVLTFAPPRRFARVVAAYNSFCLLTEPDDVMRFFARLAGLLEVGGRASLNYYSVDRWPDAVAYSFRFEGGEVRYTPSFDLTARDRKLGVWIDAYATDAATFTHRYEVRIYEDAGDVTALAAGTGLELVAVTYEFDLPEERVLEPGWVDYVFERVA